MANLPCGELEENVSLVAKACVVIIVGDAVNPSGGEGVAGERCRHGGGFTHCQSDGCIPRAVTAS